MLTELSDRLALIIDAKTDGAVSNIHRLSLEEKAAADRADVLKAKLADLEARAAKQSATPSGVSKTTALNLSRTRSELAGLESSLATVPQGAGLAEKGLAKLGLQGTVTGAALAKGLGGLAIGTAVIGGFELLKSGVDNYTHLADEIRGVQFAAQGSAEDASKLVAITTALGVSSDTAALGVFRLGKNIDLTPKKLTNLGVAIARDKSGNTDLIATLGNVAAAYQKTQDPARKAAIVYEAFGRAGTTMLPILNANADKLKEIAAEAAKQGRIFSAQDLANAKEYEITMRELHDSVQAVGLSLGRTLVPALSEVAGVLTNVSDAVHSNSLFGKLLRGGFEASFAPLTASLKVLGLVSGGGKGGHDKAAAALQAQQDQAQRDALEKAATATLGDSSSILATPGQGLTDALQTLKDARQTLTDAIAARNKAQTDLATVRAGSPAADATAVEAAVARVMAARAKLRAAEYIGGDARVSGAQATLLSAQATLNRLRSEGGTSTDKLATATERLHKANEAVVAARLKEQDAQRAKNQATGFSATDVQKQLDAQLRDKTALADAQAKIAGLGASTDLIGFLDQENQKQPGTLVKFAHTATAAMVAAMNEELSQVGVQDSIYSSVAGNPDAWRKAGADRAASFHDGWDAELAVSKAQDPALTSLLSPRSKAQPAATAKPSAQSPLGQTLFPLPASSFVPSSLSRTLYPEIPAAPVPTKAGLVVQSAAQQDAFAAAQRKLASGATQPDVWAKAGKTNGDAFGDAFAAAAAAGLSALVAPTLTFGQRAAREAQGAPTRAGAKSSQSALGQALYPQTILNVGTVKVDSRSGQQLATDLAREARLANMGAPVGASL